MDPETLLLHQVHPVKLAFDISASVISNALLWKRRLGAALLTRYTLPVVGSLLVIRFADVEGLRDTPQGRYVLEHMPSAATAVRLTGDVVMGIGAWRRRPTWMLAGAVLVAAGWSHGLVFREV